MPFLPGAIFTGEIFTVIIFTVHRTKLLKGSSWDSQSTDIGVVLHFQKRKTPLDGIYFFIIVPQNFILFRQKTKLKCKLVRLTVLNGHLRIVLIWEMEISFRKEKKVLNWSMKRLDIFPKSVFWWKWIKFASITIVLKINKWCFRLSFFLSFFFLIISW